LPSILRICAPVLVARSIFVPSTFSNFGSPSNLGSNFALSRSIAAVCGTCASRTASSASGVPATETRADPRADAGGMSPNGFGNWSGRTMAHGPSSDGAENQRPEASTYTLPLATSLATLDSVFVM
jgi:hypothetical protein